MHENTCGALWTSALTVCSSCGGQVCCYGMAIGLSAFECTLVDVGGDLGCRGDPIE